MPGTSPQSHDASREGGSFKMGILSRWHHGGLPHLAIFEPTPVTPNPMGGHPTHQFTRGGFLPQKVNTYVHLEVSTSTRTQVLWHTPHK